MEADHKSLLLNGAEDFDGPSSTRDITEKLNMDLKHDGSLLKRIMGTLHHLLEELTTPPILAAVSCLLHHSHEIHCPNLVLIVTALMLMHFRLLGSYSEQFHGFGTLSLAKTLHSE